MLDRLIYGGSFDPPHRGHGTMARYVLETGVTRKLDIVPAAVSPYKTHTPPAPPEHRVAMLQAALKAIFAGEPWTEHIRVLELELRRPPPSFTADTLSELRQNHPGERLGLLMGSDSFPGLAGWNRVDEILEHHEIVVFRRNASESPESVLELFPRAAVRLLDNPLVDCSSTALRKSAAAQWSAGRPPVIAGDCLPAGVLELIVRHELYKEAS